MASPTLRSDASSPFQSALLLADEENNAFADRTALRNAGVRHFRMLTSGVETAQYLAKRVSTIIYPVTEIIVCLPNLIDMNQAEFVTLVRSHPLLPHMPLLAITTQRGHETALLKAGYSAVLSRPFNTNTLSSVLHTVGAQSRQTRAALIESLKTNRSIPSHAQFDAMLARFIPPDKESMNGAECCQYGKELLLAQRHEQALPYLQKAAKDLASKAEACLALARLWSDRREYDKVKICLFSALKGFMDTGAWAQAVVLTKKLVKEYPSAPHPLLHELERRLRQNKIMDAVAMLPHVQSSLPHDAITETLMRGSLATPDPEASLADLLDSMTQSGLPDILALRDELMSALPSAEPVKKRWYNRILSRDADAPVPASSTPTASSGPTIAQASRPGLSQSHAREQRLLSIPSDFSLVDDDRDKTESKNTDPIVLDNNADLPPPLFLPAPESFAKEVSKRELLTPIGLANNEKPKPTRNINPAYGEPVLELLGDTDPLDDISDGVKRLSNLHPSRLGDAWTMVRGTMKLYRSSK